MRARQVVEAGSRPLGQGPEPLGGTCPSSLSFRPSAGSLQFGQDGCTFRVPTDGQVEPHERQPLIRDRIAQLGHGLRRIGGRGQVVMGFGKCPSDSTHRRLGSLYGGEGRGVGESLGIGAVHRHDVDFCEFVP